MTNREPGDDTRQQHRDGAATEQEFAALFRAEYVTLVRFVMLATQATIAEAEDAVQATFIEAFRYMQAGKWETVQVPRGWLRRVAMRESVRVQQRPREGVLRAAQGGLTEPEHDPHTEHALGTVDERDTVLAALEILPEAQRTVLALQVDGFSTLEIAELLDKTPQTVRRHLYLARKTLRQKFLPEGTTPPQT